MKLNGKQYSDYVELIYARISFTFYYIPFYLCSEFNICYFRLLFFMYETDESDDNVKIAVSWDVQPCCVAVS
jgi:hypothetical protein